MAFIFATVLIDMISIGLIIPVLPVIAGSFSHTQAEHAVAYLLVAGAFGLANFIGSPILGALSDQHGRPVEVGELANVVLYDPKATRTVDPAESASLSRNTPYRGMELPGRVVATFLRGKATVLDGKLQ